MGYAAPEIRRLHTDSLWLKIESCLTFAGIAEVKYELGRADAERFLADAEREYGSLLRALAELDLTDESRRQFQLEIAGVRDRLNEVKEGQLDRA